MKRRAGQQAAPAEGQAAGVALRVPFGEKGSTAGFAAVVAESTGRR